MARSTRVLLGVLILAGGLSATACTRPAWARFDYPHAARPTLAESGEEHQHRVSRVSERDRLLLQEDLDLLFQTERATRLTRWHVK